MRDVILLIPLMWPMVVAFGLTWVAQRARGDVTRADWWFSASLGFGGTGILAITLPW